MGHIEDLITAIEKLKGLDAKMDDLETITTNVNAMEKTLQDMYGFTKVMSEGKLKEVCRLCDNRYQCLSNGNLCHSHMNTHFINAYQIYLRNKNKKGGVPEPVPPFFPSVQEMMDEN